MHQFCRMAHIYVIARRFILNDLSVSLSLDETNKNVQIFFLIFLFWYLECKEYVLKHELLE